MRIRMEGKKRKRQSSRMRIEGKKRERQSTRMRIDGRKRKRQSTAETKGMAEELPSLPFDLIVDILSRLPIKTLIRFECVSKQWYTLISDPSFVNSHRHKSPPKLRLFYIDATDIVHGRPGNFCITSMDRKGKVLQVFHKKGSIYGDRIHKVYSQNGLICFNTTAWGRTCHEDSNQIFLCNPTTHELVTLPQDSPSKRFPTRMLHTIGFAYLSSIEEYKVVRVFKFKSGRRSSFHCEILSCAAGRRIKCSSWKIIAEKWPLDVPIGCESVFAHGCLNWIVDDLDYYYYRDVGAIVSFDLMSEKFRILTAPFDDQPREITLGYTTSGKLSFIKNRFLDRTKMKIVVWVLEDYDKCLWIKAHTIDLEPFVAKYYGPGIMRFTFRVVNGKLLIKVGQKYIYFDVEDKTFRMVKKPKCGGPLGCQWKKRLVVYWESMVSH